jgi:putative oxidoreductase
MIKRMLGGHSDVIYGVLRIVAGFLFFCHGAPKLLGWFGGFGGTPGATAPLVSLIGLAGIIECGGGLLIGIGLITRIAAFIASGEMAVAYFRAHAPGGFLPLLNRGEAAVLFCFLFLYIASRGAGALSVDRAIGKD